MAKLKRILVGVDFSALSVEALDYAIELAQSTGARLAVLYVVEPIDYAGVDFLGGAPIATQSIVDEHLARARAEMERLRKRRLAKVAGATATVSVGRPADEIIAQGGKGRANLIVVGTHGRSGLLHLVMGSVAERIVRHAGCPVLVVHAQTAASKR
jgi:universal stress protein A